jgi:hypothetical protein
LWHRTIRRLRNLGDLLRPERKITCRTVCVAKAEGMALTSARAVVCLVLAFAGAGALTAQERGIEPIDLTKREERLSSRRFQGPGEARLGGERMWPGSRTMKFGSWHGRYSTLGRKLAPIDTSQRRDFGRAPLAGTRSFPALGAQDATSGFSGLKGSVHNFSRVGAAGSYGADPRLQRTVSTEAEVSREEFAVSPGAPRLEDINRYVFRKNGVDETGPAPVTPAAGGEGVRARERQAPEAR